jgi:GntR family transcriptional repressor for pyruvate dehydrogenase complex
MEQQAQRQDREAALADEVADYLAQQIRRGEPPIGGKLPTEAALGQQFAVSRAVVREAVARLKADGLVRSRQGSGLYVAGPEARRSFKVAAATALDQHGIEALFELRETLETGAARLAAERRSDAELTAIADAHAAMIRAADWHEAGLDADLHFHQAIAAAAGNVYFAELMLYLSATLKASIRRAREATSEIDIRAVVTAEHAAILEGIAARRPAAAARAMRDHIQGSRRRMASNRTEPMQARAGR